MSIRSRYRAWKAEQKAHQDMKQFTAGYNFAAGRLLSGHSTPQSLENEQDAMGFTGKFDKGVSSAIQDAIHKGLVKDDRV